MKYYWQFNLCALCIAILLCIETLRRKDMKQEKNKWFLMIIIAIMVSAISDLTGIYMQNAPEGFNLLLADVSTMIFLTVRNMLPFLYVCYVASLLKLRLRVKKWVTVLVIVPEAAMVLFMIIEPLRRFVYYYPDGINYTRGPLFNAFYVLTGFYVIIGVLMMIIYRKGIDLKVKVAFYVFTFLSLAPVIVQAFDPKLKWALFFQAIGVLGVFLTIDNEESIRSPISGYYNRFALIHDAGQLFDIGIKANVVFIKVPSVQSVAIAIGGDTVERISRDMGEFILNLIPRTWTMYEYGINQFAIICYNSNKKETDEVVRMLKERFNQTWEYENGSIQLSAEILVGRVPDNLAGIEQLVMVMDSEFVPVEAGAQVIHINEPAKQEYEAKVEMALRNAIREDRLMVYYQPICDTKEGRIHTAEALLRLKDPELGMIPPDCFIPLAEKRGFMKSMGDYVFEEVCKALAGWKNSSDGFSMVEVNISKVQCVDQTLPERWERIMGRYNIDPSQICLEITESSMATSRVNMETVIRRLKNRGFLLALDDYGTGYSNSAFIMEFPFDLIKIDKSILWGADKNEKTDKLLRHSISMIHDLNMKVVVEGVETEAQREKLEEAGVEYLQGFLFSRPVPQDQAVMLTRR